MEEGTKLKDGLKGNVTPALLKGMGFVKVGEDYHFRDGDDLLVFRVVEGKLYYSNHNHTIRVMNMTQVKNLYYLKFGKQWI